MQLKKSKPVFDAPAYKIPQSVLVIVVASADLTGWAKISLQSKKS